LNISSAEALNGTTVLNTIALTKSENLRVHDVKEAVEAVRLFNKTIFNNEISVSDVFVLCPVEIKRTYYYQIAYNYCYNIEDHSPIYIFLEKKRHLQKE
jgi:hypothetical protein